MHTMTFTVDGYIGDTNLQASVISNVTSFNYDAENKILQLNFASKPSVFVAVGTMATMTVTVVSGRVTAVTVAD